MERAFPAALLLILAWLTASCDAAEFSIVRDPNYPAVPMIFLRGEIKSGDQETFHTLTVNYDKAIVNLFSEGGNVDAALAIGAFIAIKNFATSVPPDVTCASACALIWIAGNHRYLSPSSRIGFHAAYVDSIGGTHESGVANATVGAYLTNLGLPLTVVKFATTAPPEGMQWLTIDSARALGIAISPMSENGAPLNQSVSIPVSQSPAAAPTDMNARIGKRLAGNFSKQYKRSGMAGLNGSIQTCYSEVKANPQKANVVYCMALDFLSCELDAAFSSQFNAQQLDFDTVAAANARAHAILSFIHSRDPEGAITAAKAAADTATRAIATSSTAAQ
jgi:hypothetical protein